MCYIRFTSTATLDRGVHKIYLNFNNDAVITFVHCKGHMLHVIVVNCYNENIITLYVT